MKAKQPLFFFFCTDGKHSTSLCICVCEEASEQRKESDYQSRFSRHSLIKYTANPPYGASASQVAALFLLGFVMCLAMFFIVARVVTLRESQIASGTSFVRACRISFTKEI